MTRRELEVTDPAVIRHILDESKVLHLGLVDDGMPYIVPMNYGCKWEADKLTLYLHSASRGYKLDVIAKNPVWSAAWSPSRGRSPVSTASPTIP